MQNIRRKKRDSRATSLLLREAIKATPLRRQSNLKVQDTTTKTRIMSSTSSTPDPDMVKKALDNKDLVCRLPTYRQSQLERY